jgi:hypothetical protein
MLTPVRPASARVTALTLRRRVGQRTARSALHMAPIPVRLKIRFEPICDGIESPAPTMQPYDRP